MSNFEINKATKDIKLTLDIFDKVGIATKNSFDNIEDSNYPEKILSGYQSIIVFAQGQKKNNSGMNGFDDFLGTLAAQSEVLNYLNSFGYKSKIIEGTSGDISLVKLGVASGVGELSPVDSLVVKGHGLTTSLGAIITDAPLIADEKSNGVCIKCMKCLRVCPIRDIPNGKGDLSKCGCGRCKNVCPV